MKTLFIALVLAIAALIVILVFVFMKAASMQDRYIEKLHEREQMNHASGEQQE